jgi:hypothetical protein
LHPPGLRHDRRRLLAAPTRIALTPDSAPGTALTRGVAATSGSRT